MTYEGAKSLVSKSFVDHANQVVLQVGPVKFTRRNLVEDLHCAHFAAAKRLQTALKAAKVATPADLATMGPWPLAAQRGVGDATLYVAMCVVEALGFSVKDWLTDGIKFQTMKAHAAAKRAAAQASNKRRRKS